MEGKVKDLVKALWEVDFEDKLTFRVIKYKEKWDKSQHMFDFIIETQNRGIEVFKARFTENFIEEIDDNGRDKNKAIFKE